MNLSSTLKIFPAFLICVYSSHAIAQPDTLIKQKTKKYSTCWTLSYEQGAMISNGSEVGDQLAHSSYYNGLEAHLGLCMNNQSDIYNQLYRHPVVGFGWYASTFHQVAIGYPNAVYYFFKLPLFEGKDQKFSISFLGALGISYNFNTYDSVTNPTNVYIGSDLNSYVNLALMLNYRFNSKWVADLSFGLKHFSNGSIKLPNFGINLTPVSLGITYKPKGFVPFTGERNVPRFIKNNQINIALISAIKNYEIGEPGYLKAGISINWLRMFTYKYRAGVGMDIFYSAQPESENQTTSTLSNSMSYGVVGSFEWVLNKHLYFPIGLGIYLKHHESNDERTWYYERIGFRYRLSNNLFAGVTIKAHKDVADIFEWTVGYTLNHDPNKY